MSYEKQTWVSGELITSEKLNHIEQGIVDAGSAVALPEITASDDGKVMVAKNGEWTNVGLLEFAKEYSVLPETEVVISQKGSETSYPVDFNSILADNLNPMAMEYTATHNGTDYKLKTWLDSAHSVLHIFYPADWETKNLDQPEINITCSLNGVVFEALVLNLPEANSHRLAIKAGGVITVLEDFMPFAIKAGDGNLAIAEGFDTTASGDFSHAEGYSTVASEESSHAEGGSTTASGLASHAEGNITTASGVQSHAEGGSTTASGVASHAEGYGTIADGNMSHAEGMSTTASGYSSHAEGFNTIANHASQHVFGEYNVADPSASDSDKRGTYVEIVGNGTNDGRTESRSNARTLDWNGNEVLAGKLTVGSAPTADMDVATKKYVDDNAGGASAQPDWNESDSTSASYIQNRPFYETSNSVTLYDGTLTLAVQGKSAQATDSTSIASDTLYDGMPITITVDGVSEEQILTSMNYGTVAYYCGNPSTTRFGVYVDPAQSTVTIYDYQNSTERSANVSVVSSQNTLVKIPAKYLPDSVVVAGEGVGSTIQGLFGNAGEGANNTATGKYAHVEGGGTSTNASTSVTTYHKNTASGDASHAEGQGTTASGAQSHAEGGGTKAIGSYSHAEGGITTASGPNSHAEGHQTTASGEYAHSEGGNTTASGSRSHAEGYGGKFTINGTEYESGATGTATHAEGYQTLASTTAQPGTHAEGYQTRATGGAAHAEGDVTNASGIASHAEGTHTNASGVYAHAEGFYTNASGVYSHAEGNHTTASGSDSSHAEGSNTTASGNFSHAEGSGTIANHASQHVFGENNVADPSTALATARGTYVEIVGNGTSDGTTVTRSNARTLDWNGNEVLAGGLTVGAAGITIGSTTITEAQLQALLATLS